MVNSSAITVCYIKSSLSLGPGLSSHDDDGVPPFEFHAGSGVATGARVPRRFMRIVPRRAFLDDQLFRGVREQTRTLRFAEPRMQPAAGNSPVCFADRFDWQTRRACHRALRSYRAATVNSQLQANFRRYERVSRACLPNTSNTLIDVSTE